MPRIYKERVRKRKVIMDLQTISQELNKRFASALPEFYKRRIVIWYDEEGEFSEQIDDLDLLNAKVLRLTENNNFVIKKTIAVDEPTQNFLIYNSMNYEKPDDNWLLDVELYSEEFRADLIAIWMDEMGLPQTSAVDLGTVPAELMSSFSLVFYQSAEDVVFKALGVE